MTNFKERQNRYAAKSRRTREPENIEDVLGIVSIDEPLLDIFCAYTVSENACIHKHGLSSLSSLMEMINELCFDKNQIMIMKYRFVCKALEIRLSGIHDRNLILSGVNRYMDISIVSKVIREISNDEVHFVEETVADYLNNVYVNRKIGGWKDVILDYEKSDFRKRSNLLTDLKDCASSLLTQIRRNEASKDNSDTLFRLSSMENSVADIHKFVTGPSFNIVTGMQGLNSMLGGGLQPGNVYSFFGLPGEGKTVTLENLLYQIWKYNRGYQCKDKTKKPCIVLLTMENFVRQTVCALFHILTKGKNLKDCKSADEAIQAFKENSFEFNPDNENSIEIVIKYKPINSVTTDYLYKIVEDLEDEGFETICFLQDYVKRILPVMATGDPYQDLGNVINDFKTFATLKSLPVVTASQLNREAAKMIDEGRNSNKLDLIKKLGRSNIGESTRIDENLDGTFIITPEVSSDGIRYMGIKMTKHRYEVAPNTVVSVYQPFHPDTIALMEDIYDIKPIYRESLMKDEEEIRQSFGDVERASINKTVKALANLTGNSQIFNEGIVMKPVIKKQEPRRSIPVKNMVFKKVVEMIPLEKAEELREKYGIKKML